MVGNSSNISLRWQGEWIDGVTLHIAFPYIFMLAINKVDILNKSRSWGNDTEKENF